MIDVLVPTTLDEALAIKAARPDATVIAGGTDVMVELNSGRLRPSALLDVSRLDELRGWSRDADHVVVGAGVTYAQIVSRLDGCVPLVEAARTVGSPQIRTRGTIGGNLGTASPAGDTLPVLAAYDAEILVASTAGRRRVPVTAFLVGPKQTALGPDELIVGARWRLAHHVGSFSKVGLRTAMAISVAGVALVIDDDAHAVRVAIGAVGPTVLRAPDAEAFAASAIGETLGWGPPAAPLPVAACEEFGALVAAASHPIDDVRATAAYRRHACQVLAARALRRLTGERTTARAAA